MLRGRFWFESQDFLGYPLGRSASFFEIHLCRLVPGLKIDFFEKLSQVSKVAEMVAEKNCLHFWGQIATKVTKHVAEPILAPESRFRGIRWGNLYHFSKSIRSDWSWGYTPPLQQQQFWNAGWEGKPPPPSQQQQQFWAWGGGPPAYC